RRDNIYKARIKILVHEIGQAKMTDLVEAEWQSIKDGPLELPPEAIEQIAAQFAPPKYAETSAFSPKFDELRHLDMDFNRWLNSNVAPHKEPGYTIVTLSLKATGEIPGDISADQMDAVADLADRYSYGEVRATHTQNLVLPHVKRADLPDLWRALAKLGLA